MIRRRSSSHLLRFHAVVARFTYLRAYFIYAVLVLNSMRTGLSSSLTYSKCPKQLLDVAYDIPLDRLILTSESPNALPAVLGVGVMILNRHC